MRKIAHRALLLTCVTAFAVMPLAAQRDMGTLLGTVTDATGAVIPGAKITITEDSTGQSIELSSDESGNYIRPLLKPGTYTAEAEAEGFKTSVQNGLIL